MLMLAMITGEFEWGLGILLAMLSCSYYASMCPLGMPPTWLSSCLTTSLQRAGPSHTALPVPGWPEMAYVVFRHM